MRDGGEGGDILLVNLDGVLMPEGRVPREELVDENAQCPPVHRGRVALVMDHFWREILGGAAERVCLDWMAGFVIS